MTDNSEKTKVTAEKNKPVSFLIKGMETRIERACELLGGKRAMSKATGIHETQLYRYISGANTPSTNAAVVIAKAAGINIEWLATGEGPELIEPEHQAAHRKMIADVFEGDPEARRERDADIAQTARDAGRLQQQIQALLPAIGTTIDRTTQQTLLAAIFDLCRAIQGEIPDNVVDADVLTDVLVNLREYQDKRNIRWQAQDEGRIASEIYQYLYDNEMPTAADRAGVLRLVTSIVEGISGGKHVTREQD